MGSVRVPKLAASLRDACAAFADDLSESQRRQLLLSFDDHDERYNWDFRPLVPWRRAGLRLVNMTRQQRARLFEILSIVLSSRAISEIEDVLRLEETLRELERATGVANWNVRDPEIYAFAIFGSAAPNGPVMIRFEGHHISVHITLQEDLISVTPFFLGAYPAAFTGVDGARMHLFSSEENMARALVKSLRPDQRRIAVLSTSPPEHLISYRELVVDRSDAPKGLSIDAMDPEQGQLVRRLVDVYLTRSCPEYFTEYGHRLLEDPGSIQFAWAGSDVPGQPHYYSIVGSEFWLEHDKTQDGGNHVHTVWRDFDGDWGTDFLAEHYRASHRSEHDSHDGTGAT